MSTCNVVNKAFCEGVSVLSGFEGGSSSSVLIVDLVVVKRVLAAVRFWETSDKLFPPFDTLSWGLLTVLDSKSVVRMDVMSCLGVGSG